MTGLYEFGIGAGVRRAYSTTIPVGDIAANVDAEVKRAAPTVRMPGFRPGKVPANLIKKMHGPTLAQEALNTAVQSLIAELEEDYAGGKDVEVKVSLEVLPQVPAPAIDGLKLERLTAEPTDEEIDGLLKRFASQQKSFEPALDDHSAVEGDQVVIDFVGKTEDGVAFPGGTGAGMAVELGSGQLIPGFEAQLEGVKLGEKRTLNVTFPENYGEKSLAGKPATFDITVTAINSPKDVSIDDEFAKSLGLEGLENLRELFKGQIEQELNGLTRTHMKRKLLDQLAASHDFPAPPSMVDAEFAQIWGQLEHEATHEADPAAAMAEMEKEREDYVAIAERRVRLGLIISEVGHQNGIEISQAEMQRLMVQAAQQYDPKDRQRFIDYVRQNPTAAARLRAPLYEDKVVDFLLEKATVTERIVTRRELETAINSDDSICLGSGEEASHHIAKAGLGIEVPVPNVEQLNERPQALSEEARAGLLNDALTIGSQPADHRLQLKQEVTSLALEILGSTQVLGRLIQSKEDLAEAIHLGFPSGVIGNLREAGWPPAVLESVIAPKRTLMRRKSNDQRLSPNESDAAWRLAYILALAATVLNGRTAAFAWLSRPKSALHRHVPQELMCSSVGTDLVASLLFRLDEGNVA